MAKIIFLSMLMVIQKQIRNDIFIDIFLKQSGHGFGGSGGGFSGGTFNDGFDDDGNGGRSGPFATKKELKELRNEIITKLEALTRLEAKMELINHLWRDEMLRNTKIMRDDFHVMKDELKRELQGEIKDAITQDLKVLLLKNRFF